MGRVKKDSDSINLNSLPELAKKNPKYARFFYGLSEIDKFVKKVTKDIVQQKENNPSFYYIKTELMAQCYNLYLFQAEKKITIGTSWPLADFLKQCEEKRIEFDISIKVSKMLNRISEINHQIDKTIWIQ